MLDLDLLLSQLRKYGHTITHTGGTPSNAGSYEFVVDGKVLNLEETRALLAADEDRAGV